MGGTLEWELLYIHEVWEGLSTFHKKVRFSRPETIRTRKRVSSDVDGGAE